MRCASASASSWPPTPCAPSTCRPATASAPSKRCARPAAPSAELDVLLEHDLALERPVHRALCGDLREPLALIVGQLLRQVHGHLELGGGAALGGLVVHVDRHLADV